MLFFIVFCCCCCCCCCCCRFLQIAIFEHFVGIILWIYWEWWRLIVGWWDTLLKFMWRIMKIQYSRYVINFHLTLANINNMHHSKCMMSGSWLKRLCMLSTTDLLSVHASTHCCTHCHPQMVQAITTSCLCAMHFLLRTLDHVNWKQSFSQCVRDMWLPGWTHTNYDVNIDTPFQHSTMPSHSETLHWVVSSDPKTGLLLTGLFALGKSDLHRGWV